ncbi:TetR/AcrR family transcriptional regulator [Rhodococcoides kyotonense]|uniref:DNA-binding transcriptional regulator, AcrR family n=1 Tax=Rhodococcoides kyotonense TaxID=398843 RepID=A0A239I7V2_9NOCA|nr:TetR/AcrR family transcriptional regulator [Rhodococcus kyotonensis]SNS89966.1 DNA-binding transcriptional regulator, AcrR family [Rhodococcus kyotonensis]
MPSPRVERETPTFIQSARRTQLVGVAIDVIAEVGAEKASLNKVAERAGVSRGVLTYHFGSRDGLLDAVVAEVYSVAAEQVGPAVTDATTPRDALAHFITGSIEFYANYPRHMSSLASIFASGHTPRATSGEHASEMLEVDMILSRGIDVGQFRPMDTELMAVVIRSILDAALKRVAAGSDTHSLIEEVLHTVLAATRLENR